MQKIVMFSMMGLLLAAGAARAESVWNDFDHCVPGKPCPPVECTKDTCFTVVCFYEAKEPTDHYKKCQAATTFNKKVTMSGGEVGDESDNSNNPRFEVKCDEHLIYNDGARRFTDLLGTRIQGQMGPYPAILLPRGELHEGHHYSVSWLELGDQTMRGSCYLYTGPQ